MNKKLNKNIGVKDIAAVAGVSIGTVDRVLHNRGEVKKETREKIMTIVKELGYKPNVFASSLATRKTTRIAIIIPDSSDSNPYWEKPIKGIKKASEELSSFNVEIIYEYFDASNEESFKEVLEKVCVEKPDGIILNPVFKSTAMHYISIFKNRKIPYAFIDVNIKGVGKLGYFGQDAEQSGIVSAKLMYSSVPHNSKIIIVKLSKNKVFSQHIESRVNGFLRYFDECKSDCDFEIVTIEIDLQELDEPACTLAETLKNHKEVKGIFVPNSRVFKVADFVKKINLKVVTVGYDLVDKNIEHLKNGNIDFLISQKPEEQAYNAIMALFNNLITKKEVAKTTYSPIDIVIKENIDYYK